MQIELPLDIKQRSDYTFKYNARLGRHGWLRLTPAYSVKLVREIISKDCRNDSLVLDPFSGTATTGLVAAEMGCDTFLFDINPFLIWFGNTKCTAFSHRELNRLQSSFQKSIKKIKLNDNWLPPIHNIERWWHPQTLEVLGSIRQQLVDDFGEPGDNSLLNLVWVAFSRLIIETSAAAFNHVSMSFKHGSRQYELSQITQLFEIIFNHVINSAKSELSGEARILKGDSRNLADATDKKFDIVITSPPYSNRISYIRELRPYMYWTKFLTNGTDAGTIDWEAIGGTWGTATSNLKKWKPTNDNLPVELYEVCHKIENSGDKNSDLMSNYVHKYFDDMYEHLKNLRPLLKPNAKLNYIVGNSSFYGHFVHVEKLLADTFLQLGYTNTHIQTIRKRNSKKGLFEFNVTARMKE